MKAVSQADPGDVVVTAGRQRTVLRVDERAPAGFDQALAPLGVADMLVFSSRLSRGATLRRLLDDPKPVEFLWRM